MSDQIDRPFTLAERYDLAEKMAKAGNSADEIADKCALTKISASCIVGRIRGDLNLDGLRKCRKDD